MTDSPPPPPPIQPLYMWAGGKNRLINQHYMREGVQFPDASQYRQYVEPFFGGGAMYCHLANNSLLTESVIGDTLEELMGLLNEVKTNVDPLITDITAILEEYFALPADKETRKTWFYRLRRNYWTEPTPAKLYVLMRTSFNGIWQTCRESEGLFATPAGLLNQKTISQIFSPEQFRNWNLALQHTTLHTGSYLTVPVTDWTGTLVYLDPPYRDSYTTYSSGFGDEEQRILCEWIASIHAAGAKVLFANRIANNDFFFKKIFDELGVPMEWHLFDVTYTAGRRKAVGDGFEAKKAIEFLAITQ